MIIAHDNTDVTIVALSEIVPKVSLEENVFDLIEPSNKVLPENCVVDQAFIEDLRFESIHDAEGD